MRTLRLKSLELNGYKTFASRTLFEFSGPITTVVGPNGSGKSNISDALRWVLGEQSYSVLRGRKTEDMIFSGSEKRPQSGMASVSIVFDNSEGWLPIDFSEVSVTRRAYRDGQNEYLINDQKTRLKDVTELLAKSALAERTYTIIGQGLVDTALTLRSDERRRLFEEAAGIGLYRARKEQSLRRLEATMRNLERAEDILAELRPRVRSLSRQAERADEFMRLRSDLHETLRLWYGYHWHHTQKDLTDYRNEADLREEGLGQARLKQAELSTELNDLRVRAQTLRAQMGDWQRRLAEQNASREQAARSLAVAVERERALVERKQALAEEKQRLEAEMKAQAGRLEETEQDAERYRAEEAEATQHLADARQILEEKRSVQEGNRAKVEAARELVAGLEAKLSEAKARHEQLTVRLERYRGELAELQGTIDAVQGDAKTIEQQATAAKAANVQTDTILEAAKVSKQQIDSELDEARAQLDELEKQHRSLLGEQAKLRAELKALRESEMASAGFALGANLLRERLRGTKANLGREIRVQAEVETAIAAALGAYADAVILPGDRDSEEALSVLETGEASATLLPLSSIRLAGKLRVQDENGLVGVAADLVEVSQDLRPLVDLLLGRVLVARDRQSARQLLAKYEEAAQVVTLRGEVFHRAGPIEVRGKKMAAGLARPREERELEVRLDESSNSLAQVEKELAEQNSLIAEITEHSKRALEDIEKAQISANAAKDSEQHLAMEVAQLAKQLDWFGTQKRSLENEIATAETQAEDVIANESALSRDLGDARKALDEEMGIIVEVPMDEQHAQVAHWEMRFAVAQRALQEAERRLNERKLGQQRTEAQLSSQQERSAELDKLMAELEAERAQAVVNQETVTGQIGSITAQLSPAEAELMQAEQALESQQNAESQALQGLSAAERAHTQAQIALGRQQEALEGLRSRIEDDFGLVAFQYEAGVSGPTPLPLGELVEQLPVVEILPAELEEALKHQRVQIRRLGSVNPEAQTEYIQVKERVQSMEEQVHDLRSAEVDLKQVIGELDVLMDKEFRTTFDRVATEFRDIFGRLFVGGSAKLVLTDEGDMTATGIDIEARLPGKRSQRLALLSGGERSLTAAALVFALLKASPTPFCVMDEVDAMLDEANVGRFTEVLRELSKTTQFVLITHNRNTVQAADVIYGITMGRDTASQVISLKLDEVNERYTS